MNHQQLFPNTQKDLYIFTTFCTHTKLFVEPLWKHAKENRRRTATTMVRYAGQTYFLPRPVSKQRVQSRQGLAVFACAASPGLIY